MKRFCFCLLAAALAGAWPGTVMPGLAKIPAGSGQARHGLMTMFVSQPMPPPVLSAPCEEKLPDVKKTPGIDSIITGKRG